MPVFETLTQYSDWGLLGLRTALAAVFLYHGLPKLRSPGQMAEHMGMSPAGPALIGLVEVFGALSLLLGVWPQIGALGLAVVMVGALYFKTVKWGSPFSAMDQMGWEFDLVLLAAALAVLLTDPGSFVLYA